MVYLALVIAVLDVVVFQGHLGFGYSRQYEQQNFQRHPAPYVEFIERPNFRKHNEYGFKGDSFARSRQRGRTIRSGTRLTTIVIFALGQFWPNTRGSSNGRLR